jgi:Leucine-rich repeat (LRR) protein
MTMARPDLENAVAQRNWPLVTLVVERGGDSAEALHYLEDALRDWPDEQRVVPIETWRAVQRGAAPPPWFSLGRHLRLERDDTLDGLDRASFLTSLALGVYEGTLAPLAQAPQLRALELGAIDDPGLLAQFPKLESLTLLVPEQLPPLGELPLPLTLRTLAIRDADDLVTLAGLERCAALRRLDLVDNRALTDIGAVALLPELERLMVVRCSALAEVSPIGAPGGLESLEMTGLGLVKALPSLRKLTRLRELVLGGAQLRDVSALSALSSLQHLRISDARLPDLEPLADLASLRGLSLFNLPLVGDIAPLARLRRLETLELTHLYELEDFEPLSALSGLKTATLQSLSGLRSLGFVAGWRALEQVAIAYCQVDDVRPLAQLASLRVVTLQALSLEDVSPLAALPRLEQLTIAQSPLPAGLDAFNAARVRVHSSGVP